MKAVDLTLEGGRAALVLWFLFLSDIMRQYWPSADSCVAVRSPRGSLSSEIGTRRRPPQVSSIAFPAPLPDLQPWPLMDMDFAISRPLVRPEMPDIRFLFVRSRFCSTLPSDATSR